MIMNAVVGSQLSVVKLLGGWHAFNKRPPTRHMRTTFTKETDYHEPTTDNRP